MAQTTPVSNSTAGNAPRSGIGHGNGAVTIMHGVHVPIETLGAGQAPWMVRWHTARARAVAVWEVASRAGGAALTGESALIALGIQPWWDNPDIHLRSTARIRTRLPRVQVGDIFVPEASVRCVSATPALNVAECVEVQLMTTGLTGDLRQDVVVLLAPLNVIAADLCRGSHPLQALHNVSVLLRHASAFDRWNLGESRRREHNWKQHILDQWDSDEGAHGTRRGREIVVAASGAIESPGESIALWALRCILRASVQVIVQHAVWSRGRWRYIDIALPQYLVAVEVAGFGKFGETSDAGRRAARDFLSRQQGLEEQGWRVMNLVYADQRRLEQFVAYCAERLRAVGVPTRAPRGPLWASADEELFARSRKWA